VISKMDASKPAPPFERVHPPQPGNLEILKCGPVTDRGRKIFGCQSGIGGLLGRGSGSLARLSDLDASRQCQEHQRQESAESIR
jgi:hypothetical protein